MTTGGGGALGGARPRGGSALTPNTVELIPTLGALFPRGGPSRERQADRQTERERERASEIETDRDRGRDRDTVLTLFLACSGRV